MAVVDNLLLVGLPEEERRDFEAAAVPVRLDDAETLQEAGREATSLFFPTGAVLSLLGVTQDGLSVEAGMVGTEGMVGLPQFFGSRTPPLQCVVQHRGPAWSLTAEALRTRRLPALHARLLHYTTYRLTELAQSATCNKFHVVRQRFARWLLTAQDRTGLDRMAFGQQVLSCMVGARRPVVTAHISRMQREGLIAYRRGHVAILDRPGLERIACECYAILAEALREYRHALLPHVVRPI